MLAKVKRRAAAAALALLMVLGLVLVAAAPAQAHHNRYTALYVSSQSIAGVPVQFKDANYSTVYKRYPGASGPILVYPQVYVPAGRDVVITYRESTYNYRATATGWHNIARIASPQHVTVRLI